MKSGIRRMGRIGLMGLMIAMTGCAAIRERVNIGDGEVAGVVKVKAVKKAAYEALAVAAKFDPASAQAFSMIGPLLQSSTEVPEGYAQILYFRAWDTNGVVFAINPARGVEVDNWLYKKTKIELQAATTPSVPGVPVPSPSVTNRTDGTDAFDELINNLNQAASNAQEVIDAGEGFDPGFIEAADGTKN